MSVTGTITASISGLTAGGTGFLETLRTDLLEVADELRGLRNPDILDQLQSQLLIRTRTYTDGKRTARGTYTDSDLLLNQDYKFRQLTTREIASSGGKYEMGDNIVGPITPFNGSIGYTEAQLQPKPPRDGVDIIYVVLGAHAGEYSRVEFRSTRPYRYEIVIRRRVTTP